MPEFAALEKILSPDRMATYLGAAGGDRDRAVRLYRWNSMASSAFFGPIHMLEVSLRNAIHEQLADTWSTQWWTDPRCRLTATHTTMVHQAIADLQRQKHATAPPDVVAALSFGFWVSLLGSGGRGANYETNLWRPALHLAFPNRPHPSRRKAVHRELDFLRVFRNRIAHHEPIFDRHLAADHDSLLRVLDWIDHDVSAWTKQHSRVPAVLFLRGDVEAGTRPGTL